MMGERTGIEGCQENFQTQLKFSRYFRVSASEETLDRNHNLGLYKQMPNGARSIQHEQSETVSESVR